MKDDAELIQATLAGDSAAFGQLVTRYQDRLLNTLAHVLGSVDDAQDIAQETLVQAFVRLETYRGTAAFYTWLYRIAMNRAMSFKRRAKPTASIELARESVGQEPVDQQDRPDGCLMRRERVAQVQAALGTLSREHRAVMVLREIDGYDYDTISNILDLPVGTVRSRLHRARWQLKETLKNVLQEEVS